MASSLPIWRMASKKDAMSPVPPIAEQEVDFLVPRHDEFLDGVGDVRDHLHRAAEMRPWRSLAMIPDRCALP